MNDSPDVHESDVAWEDWGARDPYFAVLARKEFRGTVLTAERKDEFFEEGRRHAAYVRSRLDAMSTGGPVHLRRILDFGCGVGRLLVPFAAMAEEVVGLDISASMLAEARRNCSERTSGGVILELSEDTLAGAPGQFDLVHSSIVLQHIAPERGRRLFAALVAKVKSGGYGALHVSYGWSAHGDRYGQPLAPEPELGFVHRSVARIKKRLAKSLWSRAGPPLSGAPVPPSDPPMLM